MAVVAAIIGIMSTIIIINFSRTKIDLDLSTNIVTSSIREAQSKAISSAQYAGYNPCGYGIHYIDATHYAIYVGPNASITDCASTNKNYQSSEDTITTTQTFTETNVQFMSAFNDIYFVPPDPTTYLDNSSSLNQSPIQITVGVTGTTCPQQCQSIYVYPSGKIESP